MGKHYKFSPSRLPALALCAGRHQAEEAARAAGIRDESSPAAIDGTRRHLLAEWRQKYPTEPWPIAIFDDMEAQQDISSDDIAAVDSVVGYALNHPSLVDKVSGRRWLEQEVEIGRYCGLEPDLVRGTLDTGFASQREMEVLDWKFGRKVVEPGLQLKAYAIGLGALLDWKGVHQHIQRGTVKLTIGQPANYEKPINSVTYPISALSEWGEEIKAVVEAALAPEAKRTPGDSQCRFCLAAGTCRARLDFASNALSTVFTPASPAEKTLTFEDLDQNTLGYPIPPPPPPRSSVDVIADIAELRMTKDPEEMTAEETGKLLDQAPLIEGFIKSVQARAKKMLNAGKEIPGWKMVPGKNKRDWKEGLDVQKMLKSCGLKLSEIYPRKTPSVAQAETMVKVKGPRRMAKFEGTYTVAPGAPVLAPEGDSRSSVTETMFEPIQDRVAEAVSGPTENPEAEKSPVANTETTPDWMN